MNILITGENSYIGTSLEKYLSQWSERYQIHTISLLDDEWKQKDFSEYDVLFHVAAIVHKKEKAKMKSLYFKINRDLAIDVAIKAKKEGVRQFIFMSTMAVYGHEGKVGEEVIITRETKPDPKTYYGKSKLEAEIELNRINDDNFKIVILRPPMIYGKGAKGNYPKLAKVAQRLSVFPAVNNKRSMIHVDNLCESVRLMIENEESGLFFPQNSEYVNTSEMVKLIAEVHAKKITLTKEFNGFLKLMGQKVEIVNKVFGNLVYEESISRYKDNYRIRDLRESIKLTESGDC